MKRNEKLTNSYYIIYRKSTFGKTTFGILRSYGKRVTHSLERKKNPSHFRARMAGISTNGRKMETTTMSKYQVTYTRTHSTTYKQLHATRNTFKHNGYVYILTRTHVHIIHVYVLYSKLRCLGHEEIKM